MKNMIILKLFETSLKLLLVLFVQKREGRKKKINIAVILMPQFTIFVINVEDTFNFDILLC